MPGDEAPGLYLVAVQGQLIAGDGVAVIGVDIDPVEVVGVELLAHLGGAAQVDLDLSGGDLPGKGALDFALQPVVVAGRIAPEIDEVQLVADIPHSKS